MAMQTIPTSPAAKRAPRFRVLRLQRFSVVLAATRWPYTQPETTEIWERA